MKATNVLMEEHRVIEGVLDTLEHAASMLEGGVFVRPGLFIDAAQFISGFADGCHHQKEEGVLFPAMADHGVPVANGPIGAMLSDHENGRSYTRQMRNAAQRLEAGEMDALPLVVENARSYVALLRAHIQKEDHILFPMADRVIPVHQHDVIWDGFENVEHEETGEGVHEKYLALANTLSAEIQESNSSGD